MKKRRLLSLLLSLAMMLTMMPSLGMVAYATDTTSWSVGDTVDLAGSWFYNDDADTNTYYHCRTAFQLTSPRSNNQWEWFELIPVDKQADIMGNENDMEGNVNANVFITPPSGKTSSDTPSGIKIKSGSGTKESPYMFELVYSTVAITGVTLNKETTSLTVGGTETLTATVKPDDATDTTVTWSSSDTDVATVSDGTVTGVKAGTATITATATNGTDDTSDDKAATCTVTVNEAATSDNYLTFTGVDIAFTLSSNGLTKDGTLEYSTDASTWATWDGKTAISSTGESPYVLYVRGSDNTYIKGKSSGGLQLSAPAACSGNIMTLLDYEGPSTTITAANAFQYLFCKSANLTSAPELPATTLTNYCYRNMFYGCTGLTSAPALPATTLANNCYNSMFYGCTGLTSTPTLSATTLADYCYSSMFYGCKGLTKATTLPADELAEGCYQYMFRDCTALTEAPALQADKLASYCYSSMFYGCTGLTSAPALPAKALETYCYKNMFCGCTALTEAPALQADKLASSCYSNMFSGCTGLTKAPALPATTLASHCYEYMFLKCANLKSAPELSEETLADYCYQYMFQECTSLESAPALRAKELKNSCYKNMFSGCTSLTSAPELPATTLAASCYYQMFSGCTALTSAPELPVEKLADSCYYGMFAGCTSLKTAPALPADTLAQQCYKYMFQNCTGLTSAPALPANTLASYCYSNMFYGCTGLTEAPALQADTLASYCYSYMFYGCTGLTETPALQADTLASYCYSNMFSGCTGLTSAPELSVETLADFCYFGMFQNCTSLTNAPDLPAKTLTSSCYKYMFYGCTSLYISDQKGTYDGITYDTEYRIPKSGDGTTASYALTDMFSNTGGKFTGTPSVNTTYYIYNSAAHTHEFTYEASGATITATCSADGCELPSSSEGGSDHIATLTISAPATGGGAAVLTQTPADSFIKLPAVKYQTKTETGWSDSTETAPQGDGFYKASITLGEGDNAKTASVTYGVNAIKKVEGFDKETAHGDFEVPAVAACDASISITTSPDAGYVLDTLTVTRSGNTEVEVTKNGNTGSFTMPNENVTVNATFKLREVSVNLTAESASGCSASLLNDSYKEIGESERLSKKAGEKFALSIICDDSHDFTIRYGGDNSVAVFDEFSTEDIKSYIEANGSVPVQTHLFWVTVPGLEEGDYDLKVSFPATKSYTVLYQPEDSNTTKVWCRFGLMKNDQPQTLTAKMSADATIGSQKVWSLNVSGAFDPTLIAFGTSETAASEAATTSFTVKSSASDSDWTNITGGKFVVIGGKAKVVAAAFVSGTGSLAVFHDDDEGNTVASGSGRGDGVSYQIAVCLMNDNGTVVTAGSVTAPKAPAAPEGKVFDGWRVLEGTAPNKTEKTYAAESSINISENVILNAVWKATALNITLNRNGGSGGSSVTSASYGEKLSIPENPSKKGYVFDGWVVSEAVSENGVSFAKGTSFDFDTPITADLKLTAQWKHVHSYKCYQISDFGSALSKYQKYEKAIHIAICGCNDIKLEAHKFDSNGKCSCGYKKPGTEEVTLNVSYGQWTNGNYTKKMQQLPEQVKEGQEVSIYAPGTWGSLKFSKWQYSTDGKTWYDLTADAYVSFLIPASMQVRALYINPVTKPQIELSARSYATDVEYNGKTYKMDSILFQMNYKLPDGYTYLDSGVRMGDNQGISFYKMTERKTSAAEKAAEFGVGALCSFLGSNPIEYAIGYGVDAAKGDEPQYVIEKREDSVLGTMSAATLSEYMYKKKPINIEEYTPIYWESNAATKALSGSVNTLVPVRFAQKNNQNHFIYGIGYLRYKTKEGKIQTITTEGLATTLNTVDKAGTVKASGN